MSHYTYVGVQLAHVKHVQFGALLVNDANGFTRALVYYNSKAPVRIVYLEEES